MTQPHGSQSARMRPGTHRRRYLLYLLWVAVAGWLGTTAGAQDEQQTAGLSDVGSDMLTNVHWLGHAGIKITGEKVIYVDPYQIRGGETADLILITHDHFDHLSPDDIARVRGEQTVIVIAKSAKHDLKGRVESMAPGDTLTLAGVEIRAVPAYNLDKKFHPRSQENVGYIFTTGGTTYYHAGDTDLIPEMEGITADVAFLPVGGTYTMDAAEAAQATRLIKPTIAVPIHWGTIVGSDEDARAFQQACDCEVRILKPEP